MLSRTRFYIDGEWVDPAVPRTHTLLNPATEEPCGEISLGSKADIDRAVAAARRAFPSFSKTSREERVAILDKAGDILEARKDELARLIAIEMGSPIPFSFKTQIPNAVANFRELSAVLRNYEFEKPMGGTMIRREPIGVCGVITPWNWPYMPLTAKFTAAFAAGCTVVAKPSEFASMAALLLAEILHEAGVPKGVFNLVTGLGPDAGHALASHPDVDKLTFTGSVPAGITIAQAAAANVKRVTQELGGKSANIILPDADLAQAIPAGVARCCTNTGQSCQAPSRMLIHRSQRDEVIALARKAAASFKLGDPLDLRTTLGPMANKAQYEKTQRMIARGIEEGATLVAGGLGLAAGFTRGYFAQPTVFVDVTPEMTVAREEIFGPVLSIIAYDDVDQAIGIANGTPFGLAGFIQGKDPEGLIYVAERLRAGRIYIGADPLDELEDRAAPFGGYKQSGNGRERGIFGFEDCLEVKAMLNYRNIRQRIPA